VSGTSGSSERPPATDEPGMTGGRIALLVAGILVCVLALAVLAAGAAVLVFNETERDSDGFFATADEPYAAEGYAIVSEDIDVGTDGPDWLFEEGRLATIRIRGSSREPGRELFIGIGPTADVKSYLAGARYDTVTDINFDPFRVTYSPSSGTSQPTTPEGQSFWNASTAGAGTQSLEWDVAKGNWSVLVMNADASAGVDAELSLGAKVGFIFWVGLGLVIAGALLLAGGATLVYFGLRRQGKKEESRTVTRPA
jgi:hypothetical protein